MVLLMCFDLKRAKLFLKAQTTHFSIESVCFLFGCENQVRFDAFLQQVLAPLATVTRLQLEFSVQAVLGCLGNVHPPMGHIKPRMKPKRGRI